MRDILTKYRNGNYNVILLKDGTKIRYNDDDHFEPAFAESIDCSITERCDNGCEFCYLGCTPEGKHADLEQPFFDTLHAGQELALNGNDLSHPQLVKFLKRMSDKGVICNLTVNQNHFVKNVIFLRYLVDLELIHGIGISLTDSSDERLYKHIKYFDNAVLHVIDGLVTKEDIERLSDNEIKMLILGYKIKGRGDAYYDNHKEEMAKNIIWLSNNIIDVTKHFNVISFDNLAIDHLRMKEKMKPEAWEQFYMGDEGQFTYYVDCVNHKFAESSLSDDMYYMVDDADLMFQAIRKLKQPYDYEFVVEDDDRWE